MSPKLALREALNASITSGHFVDTKIYLFSYRTIAGEVCKPRALYANSVVLKSVPYFNDLFSGNYSEAATRDLDEDTTDEDAIAEHYDYESDSDLEDAEDLKATEEPPPPLRGHLFDPFCFASEANDDSESSNDDTVDDGPQDTISEDTVPAQYEERMREGKVIKIQDVAFITFQAFLFYLYTDRIEFAPFGSEANRKTRAAEIVSLAPDHVPQPSPKSIYRLADKYDVPVLKSVALKRIREGLGQCDAVRETFSRFASHYPEILEMHVENLASILTGVNPGEVQYRLNERLQAFAEGEIDHASEAFSSLWRTLTHSGGGRTTLGSGWSSWWGSPPATELTPLRIALIKSIRQGSFCDRKYSAKQKDAGDLRAPVYISSIILGDTEPKLNTLIRDPKRNRAERAEDECDSDSDYEDTVEGTTAPTQEDTGRHSEHESEHEQTVTSFLSTGAFPTWRALFFFLYTGEFEFAPLKSQGSEARIPDVGGNRRPGDPPLCSPKSICYLAGKLGLENLERIAHEDVAAKTTSSNVVREAFSKSTARLSGVREMQCQLLVSSSRNEGITTAVEEHIRELTGGQTSHCYAALSLAFRMAIEKRRNPSAGTNAGTDGQMPPGPTLQCPNLHCSQWGVLLFVRDIGRGTACETCRSRLKCNICGHRRGGRPDQCGGCGSEWN